MERRDIPYALLTLLFGVTIFLAGRWSAPTPTQTTVIREVAAAAPSIIVVPSAPVTVPVSTPEPIKSAPTPVQVPVRATKSVVTPKAVPVVPVVLEESPELVANPYKK